jgi:hypothetical protein
MFMLLVYRFQPISSQPEQAPPASAMSVCHPLDFYEHADSCISLFVQRSEPLIADGTRLTCRLCAAEVPVVRSSRVDLST